MSVWKHEKCSSFSIHLRQTLKAKKYPLGALCTNFKALSVITQDVSELVCLFYWFHFFPQYIYIEQKMYLKSKSFTCTQKKGFTSLSHLLQLH